VEELATQQPGQHCVGSFAEPHCVGRQRKEAHGAVFRSFYRSGDN
jgi:hypothetical protein